MRNYTFDFELQTIMTMFIQAMDDIVIKRYNKDKEDKDQINVRFVYAPKQRVLLDLIDKAQNLQLPVVAVSFGGITRDPSRVFNKIVGSYATSSSNNLFSNHLLQPVPIDITINLSILTRYQQDYDQIVSNFVPYYDPYIEISWRVPSHPDYEIRSQVFWSGTITTQYPTDVNAAQIARVQGDTSFTFKGWLFKSAATPVGKIFTINTDYSLEPGIHTLYTLDKNTTEQKLISAVPQPTIVVPAFTTQHAKETITVSGPSFINVTNVYLSGAPVRNVSTFYNPFSAQPSLSATYPGFNAYKLDLSAFSTNQNNLLSFAMPNLSASGKLDIIVENPAGYGKLTKYSNKTAFNPFLSGTDNYNNWVPYLPSYINGIDIY